MCGDRVGPEPDSIFPHIVPLGVSHAMPRITDVSSYAAVVGQAGYWLVDCADSPIQRLVGAGIDPLAVEGVFITHFHPDHVYGLPAFVIGLFLLADRTGHTWHQPLPICGNPHVLGKVRGLLELFASQGWLASLPIEYREIAPEQAAPVARTSDFVITAAPACHVVPSTSVRFALTDHSHNGNSPTERSLVYTGDTTPCPSVSALAAGADLLIHEATGEGHGHSSAAQAGEVAARMGAGRLGLIHYDTRLEAASRLLAEASGAFGGPVELLQPNIWYPW